MVKMSVITAAETWAQPIPFRVLGKKAGIVVLLMDSLKGTLAALLPYFFHSSANPMLIALSAIIGHVFPIFAGFKGGKAVATSAGALLVYNWKFFLLAWAIFLITILLTSMVSMASMVGFTIITIVSFFFGDPVLDQRGSCPDDFCFHSSLEKYRTN